jgi:putative transposase
VGYKPTAGYIGINGAINMVAMKSAYKFRAYPSKEQQAILNHQMYLSKEIYNLLLEKSKAYYKDTKKTLTQYRMNVWLTQIKRERPEFDELYSQVLQNISKRLSDAYKSFFRRCKEKKSGKKVKVGFPRFRKFVSSLTYPQSGFKIERKRVELSKIGRINFVNHRDIEGKTKTCTIKKTKSGEWHITFSVEKEDITPFTNGKPQIGIDLGIEKYAALSDGNIIKNAKINQHRRNHLRTLQKSVSRRGKGSQKRKKAVKRFARYAEHIARIREDFLHKLSHELVNSYSFIAYEELNVAGMMKNHHLARAIQESSWGNFTKLLQYKAESAGCVAVGVNPGYTSMTCNGCRNVQKISLSQRTFVCEKCGMSRDRDINASQNILERATEGHSGSEASGDCVRHRANGAVVAERGTIPVTS